MEEATLTFPTRELAEEFAKAWSRKTLLGHTVTPDNKVLIYNITEDLKLWINDYITNLNSALTKGN